MRSKPNFFSRYFMAAALLMPAAALAASTPDQQPDWIPSGIEQLARTAAFHTDFTFDRTMLQMASGLVDGGDPETKKAIAKLNGITVHLYRYASANLYDPAQVEAIRQQYVAAGWKHLVSKQSHVVSPNAAPINPAAPVVPTVPGRTDLFIKFKGADVVGMVVVQTSPRNLNMVALNGDLSPIDLLHLRGHFGIPKFAGDGFGPAEDN
jgi:hypothetical protein